MTDIAIRAQNLSKLYHIGRLQQRHDTLRDALADLNPLPRIARILRRDDSGSSGPDETIWALKDVSFEVKRGEVVGIIGRNGAGKSTLLKILSRITEPTEGRAEIHGRVGSLLEVGTGFHHELTGRENIYLSGAILGMRREEIDRKFDEIVDFSGVEQFIDTPIKRYSSGMNVRLGFAVAAHLEPEILLVDEVLAVGDAAFQRQCLGKMDGVAREGRTVLFVSHNMAAVSHLCPRALVLEDGRIATDGSALDAIENYLRQDVHGDWALDSTQRDGSGRLRFTSFHCEDANGRETDHLMTGEPAQLVLGFTSGIKVPRRMELSVVVRLLDGTVVTNLSTHYFFDQPPEALATRGLALCSIRRLPLRTGSYVVDLYSSVDGEMSDRLQGAASFQVSDGDYYRTGRLTRHSAGVIAMEHEWSIFDATALSSRAG